MSDRKETMEERYARKMADLEAANRGAETTSEEEDSKPAARALTMEERMARKMAEMGEASHAGLTRSRSDKSDRKETPEERKARKRQERKEQRQSSNRFEADTSFSSTSTFGSSRGDLSFSSTRSKKERRQERLEKKKKKKSSSSMRRHSSTRSNSSSDSTRASEEWSDELLPGDSDDDDDDGELVQIPENPDYDSHNDEEDSDGSEDDDDSDAMSVVSEEESRRPGTGRRPPKMTRVSGPTATTTSKGPVPRAEGEDEFEPGAYRVEARAVGARPAWAQNSSQPRPNVNDDLPPEMRGSADSDLPPEMRSTGDPSGRSLGGFSLQEQNPSSTGPLSVEADLALPEHFYDYKPDWDRKRWIIVGVSVILMVGAAVGVTLALVLRGGEEAPVVETDPCDFTEIDQPSVILQCKCDDEITKMNSDNSVRYGEFLRKIIPKVNPDFAESKSSCSHGNLALSWLATEEVAANTDDLVILVNRFVLAYLFFAWQGTGWTRSEGWLSSQSECDWYGITCEEQDIVGIELGDNALESGQGDGLPEEVFALTSLAIFNISGGFLSGTIPGAIVKLDKLVTLDIGGFYPRFGQYAVDLFRIPNLRTLGLSYDTVGGSLPTEIGLAVNLETFYADYAQLTYEVPSEIGKLTNLETLILNGNVLTGILPTEIGLLKNLKYFDISFNNNEGLIPSELGTLSSLEVLDMGINGLTGTIPTEVAGLPNLRSFRLRQNRLTGTVPVELLSSGNLECFDAANTFMANPIPQGACPASTPDESLVVVCDEEGSEACSCCICEPLISEDVCRVLIF